MYVALIALGIWMLVLTGLASLRYRSLINPLAINAAIFATLSVLAPGLYYALGLFGEYNEQAVLDTIGLSALYFTCTAIPFLTRPQSTGYAFFRSLVRMTLPPLPRLGRFVYAIFALQFVVFFAVLMYASETTEWITAPRTAYQESRAGVGVWWALSQSMLVLLLMAFLFRRPRGVFSILTICLVCAACAYFLGSKAYMLYPFILVVFYYEYAVKRIPRMLVLLVALCVLGGILLLQILQGTASTIADTIQYFDYFPNTAMFIADFDWRFGHTWGGTQLSSLWQYVPRGLYPDKPYTYGPTVIMEDYNPGAGELGATPGILPWAAAYLDFGWAGVAAAGLIKGEIIKGTFRLFQQRRDMTSMLIFAQLGLGVAQPFFAAPLVVFWVWLGGQIIAMHAAATFRRLLAQASARNENPVAQNIPPAHPAP